MLSYSDYLAARGYQRVTVERSSIAAQPGHLVLDRVDQPVRSIAPAEDDTVVVMKRRVVASRGIA